MKIQLIISGQTEPSQITKSIWQTMCEEQALSLDVVDSETSEGQSLVEKLVLRTLPALVVDNQIIAVGQPDRSTAKKVLQLIKEKN